MKYTYKQTGVIVESDIPLDSHNFTPVSAQTEKTAVAENVSAAAPVKRAASARRK